MKPLDATLVSGSLWDGQDEAHVAYATSHVVAILLVGSDDQCLELASRLGSWADDRLQLVRDMEREIRRSEALQWFDVIQGLAEATEDEWPEVRRRAAETLWYYRRHGMAPGKDHLMPKEDA